MGQTLERIAVPALVLLASAIAFGLLLIIYAGVDPLEAFALMYQGAFGSWFSWQNTLTRAAPLILTALCTALPARLGLVVIGNEGALVVGGVAAAAGPCRPGHGGGVGGGRGRGRRGGHRRRERAAAGGPARHGVGCDGCGR